MGRNNRPARVATTTITMTPRRRPDRSSDGFGRWPGTCRHVALLRVRSHHLSNALSRDTDASAEPSRCGESRRVSRHAPPYRDPSFAAGPGSFDRVAEQGRGTAGRIARRSFPRFLTIDHIEPLLRSSPCLIGASSGNSAGLGSGRNERLCRRLGPSRQRVTRYNLTTRAGRGPAPSGWR